jgi:homoserine dehydrogenase
MWSHAGPLYPAPNDPSGYVSSSSIEFRRDLTATREKKKDYDRDLPDETTRYSATLTSEQFEKLAAVCAANDIANEPNATDNRTEAASTLVIEYNGEKKSIVTSNRGRDSERVANVIAAIKQLENSLKWDPSKGQ